MQRDDATRLLWSQPIVAACHSDTSEGIRGAYCEVRRGVRPDAIRLNLHSFGKRVYGGKRTTRGEPEPIRDITSEGCLGKQTKRREQAEAEGPLCFFLGGVCGHCRRSRARGRRAREAEDISLSHWPSSLSGNKQRMGKLKKKKRKEVIFGATKQARRHDDERQESETTTRLDVLLVWSLTPSFGTAQKEKTTNQSVVLTHNEEALHATEQSTKTKQNNSEATPRRCW